MPEPTGYTGPAGQPAGSFFGALRRFFAGATATVTLILACLVTYLATAVDGRSLTDPTASTIGGNELAWQLMINPTAVVNRHEYWRLATGALVHLNIGHLVMNLLVIAFIGRELERAYGTLTMTVSMALCAVGGGLAVVWMEPGTVVGGASTIGYGMFAMLVGLAVSRGTDIRAPIALIVVNVVYTVFVGGVSLSGHLGGLAVGAVIALVLYLRGRRALAS